MKATDRDPRYQRGRDFEARIAKLFRQKGFPAVRDSKSGAGWFKGDIRLPGQDFHLEAKSQEKIRLSEFWGQTASSAGYKTPILALDMGGYNDLVVMRMADFLDLIKTIADDTEHIRQLQQKQGDTH